MWQKIRSFLRLEQENLQICPEVWWFFLVSFESHLETKQKKSRCWTLEAQQLQLKESHLLLVWLNRHVPLILTAASVDDLEEPAERWQTWGHKQEESWLHQTLHIQDIWRYLRPAQSLTVCVPGRRTGCCTETWGDSLWSSHRGRRWWWTCRPATWSERQEDMQITQTHVLRQWYINKCVDLCSLDETTSTAALWSRAEKIIQRNKGVKRVIGPAGTHFQSHVLAVCCFLSELTGEMRTHTDTCCCCFSPQRAASTGVPSSARPPSAAPPPRTSKRLRICRRPAAGPRPDWTWGRCTSSPRTCTTHTLLTHLSDVLPVPVLPVRWSCDWRTDLVLMQRHDGSQWSRNSRLLSSVSASSFPDGDTVKARTLSLPVSSEPPSLTTAETKHSC